MGCNASRFEAVNGTTFLDRLEAIKGRHHRPLHDPTTLSKKELLSHGDDMKFSVSSSRPSNVTPVPCSLGDIITNTPNESREENVGIAIIIHVADDHTNKETPKPKKKGVTFINIDDSDDDEDEDDDERRIGYPNGKALHGSSPSFRVYYEESLEHRHNEVKYGNNAYTGGVSDVVPTKVEKKVKREKKKRCFRKVLPKKGSQADVKRLLNMKSCYS